MVQLLTDRTPPKNMKAIVAMDNNRGIGINGGLPWNPISQDFKWFKEFTTGQTLIVGRSTFETLPFLKDRNLVVLTNSIDNNIYQFQNKNGMNGFIIRIKYLNEFLTDIDTRNHIVIGGAKTYKLMLPHITEFYVTHVNGIYNADVFMPEFEHLFNSQEIIKEFDGHRVIKYS